MEAAGGVGWAGSLFLTPSSSLWLSRSSSRIETFLRKVSRSQERRPPPSLNLARVKPPEITEDLGPGSYDTAPAKHSRPSYAPFNTTQNRQEVGSKNDVPGPGSYSNPPPHQWDNGGGRNAFRSTLDRFRPPPTMKTPGPGAYKTEGNVLKKRPAANKPAGSGHSRMEWVRVPTAPSIPRHNQSYGYEEGAHGELVMQQPVWKGYSGMGADRVGPLDYNPRIDFTRPTVAKTLNFAKYSGRDDRQDKSYKPPATGHGDLGVMEQPEPEPQQHSEAFLKSLHQFKRKSAVFSSTTKRPTAGKEARAPGPGAYHLPGAINVQKTKKRAHQNFGASSSRFISGPREQYRLFGGPGPGAYRQPRSDFDRDKRRESLRNLVRNPSAPAAAFESTSLRFEERRGDECKAAPGSYDLPHFGVELERKRRLASKVAVFGSTAKRFEGTRPKTAVEEEEAKKKDLLALSEGAATPREGHHGRRHSSILGNLGRRAGGGWNMGVVKGRDTARESAAFASETERKGPMQETTAPPPGSYDVSAKWELNKCAVSMDRGAERFVKQPDEFERNRGPGLYQLPASIKVKPTNRRNVMLTGSKRFGPNMDQFSGRVPGPGAYDVEPFFGSMIRPTYNVLIAEECGAL